MGQKVPNALANLHARVDLGGLHECDGRLGEARHACRIVLARRPMRPSAWAPWLCLFTCCVCLASAAAEEVPLSVNVRAGGIDSSQREQSGSRIRRGSALGVVHAPADKVMQVVLDYGNYRRFMPNFQASRVLSRRGSDALVYIQVTALGGFVTLWAEMRMRTLPQVTPTRVILAHMIKGNLDQFEADWQVTPLDATRTLVLFELCADPHFPLPFASGIVSDQNETEANRTIDALRAYMAKIAQP